MYIEDTIAAIATPPGEGGIGIIRISGSDAQDIAKKVFVTSKGQQIEEFKNRFLHYGKIKDRNGEIIDEVLLVLMKGPNSYTKEDVVEIHCHGGIVPVKRILKLVLGHGARLAEPGEFTKRAFLNGRVDLAQAEAIMDLICAKSDEAARASIKQIEGSLSKKIRGMRKKIVDVMAHIEVTIDYPEEDIEDVIAQKLKTDLYEIDNDMKKLLDTAEQGKLIRQGIKTVIIGKPNVGKSSLLNALVRENRAIVTDIPGTTRDIIEEYINIRGVLVRIVDTAGIRETLDVVEKIGVEKSKESIKDADLIILVLDASRAMDDNDKAILRWIKGKKALILFNKMDKPVKMDLSSVKEMVEGNPVIETSFLTGKGIDQIEEYIYDLVFKGEIGIKDHVMLTNIRHQEAVAKARNHIQEALKGIDKHIPLDLISIDLRESVELLGTITGETVTEDLVEKIFSDFCLGK